MIIRSVFMAASMAMLLPTAAMAAPSEVGYTQGSLAVSDLTNGRFAEAEKVLAAQSAEDARDPARLINLGIAYARSGQASKARTTFLAVAKVPDEALMLSDGSEQSSRSIAREQLAMLDHNAIALR